MNETNSIPLTEESVIDYYKKKGLTSLDIDWTQAEDTLKGLDLAKIRKALTPKFQSGMGKITPLEEQGIKTVRGVIEKVKEWAIPTPIETASSDVGNRPVDILLDNFAKGIVGFPIDVIQRAGQVLEKKGLPAQTLEAGKQVGGLVKSIAVDLPMRTLKQYSYALSPLATAEQRKTGLSEIAQEPWNLFAVAGLGKGLAKIGEGGIPKTAPKVEPSPMEMYSGFPLNRKLRNISEAGKQTMEYLENHIKGGMSRDQFVRAYQAYMERDATKQKLLAGLRQRGLPETISPDELYTKLGGGTELYSGFPIKDIIERQFITKVKAKVAEVKEKVAGEYVPRPTDELAMKARTLIKEDINTAENLVKMGTDEKAVATASELIKHYNELAQKDPAQSGLYYDKVAEVTNTIAPKLTEMGRSVQAASILSSTTPEGMLRFAAREIQRFNETAPIHKRIPELTGEQAKYILEETKRINGLVDSPEKAMAWQNLQNYISDLVPTPAMKKIINIWKAGLLTGIKTSGVNTLSNLFHGISEIGKDIPTVGVDGVASLFTGKRTVGLTGKGIGTGVIEGFLKGWRYFRTGFDERNIAAKLDYHRVSYGKSRFAKILRGYEQTVFRSMGAEDQPPYYGAKAHSLQSQAIAQARNQGLRGAQAKTFVDNLVDNPTDEMLKYAVNDAEMAVFQNQTLLGKVAKQIQQAPAGQVVVPFGRTPAAVATQLINYSPVGIVKTIAQNIGKGKFDQRLFAQGLGRGITGTAVMYVGMELFKKGLMTLDRPQGEKEQKLWDIEGRQPNSIKIGNQWRNANVLGPTGFVLLTGGHLQRGIENTGSFVGGLAEATSGGARSLTEQTFLKGLNSVVDALNDPSRFMSGFGTSLAGSIVPTIVSDVARATDFQERRTESPLEGIKGRIPGLRETLQPRVDILGKTEKRGSFLEIMLDPTRPSTIKSGPVINELRRLWDKGYKVSPTQLGDKKGYDALTPPENTQLWQLTGFLTEKSLNKLFSVEEYRTLPDEMKGKLVSQTVDEAKKTVRAYIIQKKIEGLDQQQMINKLAEFKQSGLLTQEIFKMLDLNRQEQNR